MEEYNSLTENYYRSAKAIIQVFSFGSSESFSYMENSVTDIKSCDYAPDGCFFLVGNKTDIDPIDRQVPLERADVYLQDNPAVFENIFQTSAKNGKGIIELFKNVAHTLVRSHTKPQVETNLIAQRYQNRDNCCS